MEAKITRRGYAEGLAVLTYPHDAGKQDILARLMDRELSRNYDALGNRKEKNK